MLHTNYKIETLRGGEKNKQVYIYIYIYIYIYTHTHSELSLPVADKHTCK